MADQPNVLQPGNNYDEKGKVKVTEGQPEGHSFPGEMIPSSNNRDCNTEYGSGWGKAAASYPYIWFGNMSEKEWETQNALNPGACRPWRHSTATIDSLNITGASGFAAGGDGIIGQGNINITGNIAAATLTSAGTVTGNSGVFTIKPFNIPHPTKEGKRLVHACLEGPENGVYFRGRLSNKNIIELPEYWRGLVDPETITVTLTQIGTSQDLIVDSIEWGRIVKVKSGNATKIDCFYTVYGTRKDVAPLPVEMEEGEEWPYKELSTIKIN